jgi:pimeloyl-ACP methyl ester carboxylesterase
LPYAHANGQRLYYEIHGRGEPLLCIQGVGVDVSGWRPQIPAWSKRYRTIVFDNRDVGRSSYASEPYDVRDLASDTLALADELSLGRFHLLGSSLGGAVAQEVALAAPGRVISLTLSVSYAGNSLWDRERVRLMLETSPRKSDQELAAELMLLTLSEESYASLGDREQVEMMQRLVLSYPHHQRRDGFDRQLAASATHEAYGRLGRVTMPVHVIGAEHDLFVPVWKSRELARLIPGARLSVISAAGHAVNLERTQQFNALVVDFLESVAGARSAASG